MLPPDPSPIAGRRILIVEDEFLIACDIAMMLEDLGCEVVGPVSAIPEAIEAIVGEKLDGVLLDANLRGMSSASIAVELSARRIPFVVATGYGSLEIANAALQAAPRVHKPFHANDIAAALSMAIVS